MASPIAGLPIAGLPIAVVTAVTKEYRLGQQLVSALRGVDLTVYQGEFLALAGSSGSGKTTLLNLLGCLDTPTSGTIEVLGIKTMGASDTEAAHLRANKLGFVFQNFNLIPVLSAVENVEYPLLKRHMTARDRRERAMQALARVGLAERMMHRPDELSGGQRQRVAIARAIVHEPALVIADEPTAALDKKTALEILDLLAELRSQMGLTVVMASHDPLALSKASRVVEVSDGMLVKGQS